ncbi:MAG TPA: serine/threonine-protein kinase [Kofleriaceae bacterium]
MSTRCHSCDETLDDDARFCGVCGVSLVDANFGRRIGNRYVLRQRVGAGSLGVVYRAEQIGLGGRKLAIKLLPDTAQHDPLTVERFRREGQVLVSLRSQHTVTTYEFDREPDGSLYIAMELSPGRSLAHVLEREGPLPWQRVMRILVGLCDSLGEAHALGIVHRDLKPENILLEERATNRQFVKVSDFGLARVLGANLRISPVGQNVGAVELAAPESLLDRPIDGRADLYSLGVLAYLLIAGVHPFRDSQSFGEMVAAHIQKVPAPVSTLRPDVPSDVDSLLACLLEKDPNRRYPDAQTLAAQLGLLLSGVPPEPGATIRTDEGEEDTFVAEMPKR